MLSESWDYYNTIEHGIVMPETLNHIFIVLLKIFFMELIISVIIN